MKSRHAVIGIMTLAVALVASACAAGGLTPEQNAVVDAANVSASSLTLTSDVSTSEVLDGRTGKVTSIREVVTGDRPVLMWYWAPN